MTDRTSPSITQRIEDAINAAGLRATAWILGKLADFHPPRWLVRAVWIGWIAVFVAEIRGDLTLKGWVQAMIDIAL